MKSFGSRYSERILLGVGLSLGLVFLIIQTFSITTISHDDSISYLAATGHQALFDTTKPSDKWVPSSRWQAFWAPDKFWIFGTIEKDLNNTDIHPPMYFWILHIWSFLYGIKLSTGPLLNIPFHILISLMIFFVCRLLQYPKWVSASSAALWMLSSSILKAGVETRQYSLLGLMAICFIYFLLLFKRKSSIFTSFCLSIITLLGLLTHYQFVLLTGIAFVWMGILFIRQHERRSLKLLIYSSFGIAATFLIINPEFYKSLIRQQEQTSSFILPELPYRFSQCISSLLKLIVPDGIASSRTFLLLFVIGLLVFVCVQLLLKKRNLRQFLSSIFLEKYLVFTISTLTTFAIFILYISNRSPIHAMSVKYLMLVSPLLFVVVGQSLALADRNSHRYTLGITMALLIFEIVLGSYNAIIYSVMAKQYKPPIFNSESVPLIVDSTRRGILPRILWDTNPNSPVYAATQDSIINNFPDLADYSNLYYISDISYENSIEKQKIILQLFAIHNFNVQKVDDSNFNAGAIYELQKIMTPAP